MLFIDLLVRQLGSMKNASDLVMILGQSIFCLTVKLAKYITVIGQTWSEINDLSEGYM